MVQFQVGRIITDSFKKKNEIYSKCSAARLAQDDKRCNRPHFLDSNYEIPAQKHTLKATDILGSFKLFPKIFGFDHLCMSKDVFVFVLFHLPFWKRQKFFVLICLNNITSKHNQWKYNPLSSIHSRCTHRILRATSAKYYSFLLCFVSHTYLTHVLCRPTASPGSALSLDTAYKSDQILANL